MYRWMVRRLVPPLLLRIVGGSDRLARRIFTPDAEFLFPGTHSWAAHYTHRGPIVEWLADFAALRPNYTVQEVVVAGWPWSTRVAVRFRDQIGDHYENEGMHYLGLRWGRVCYDRVYLDTQRIQAWETAWPEMARPR